MSIQRTHDQYVDAIVKRLEKKHNQVGHNKSYFKGSKIIGEMDVYTMDFKDNRLFIHYFEIKTGNVEYARRRARTQAGNFYHNYQGIPRCRL